MKVTINIPNQLLIDAIERANLHWTDCTRGSWNAQRMRLTVYVVEDDDNKIVLTRKDFARGLAIMASGTDKDAAYHYKDLIADEGDMYTGDALVQCAAFGEMKYG